MVRLLCLGACAVTPLPAAQPPSAGEIMRRVAANQDRAQELRSAYVYQQKLLIRVLDSRGRLRRGESGE